MEAKFEINDARLACRWPKNKLMRCFNVSFITRELRCCKGQHPAGQLCCKGLPTPSFGE